MDFKFTEICNFEPIEFIVEKILNPINPFQIIAISDQIIINSFEDLEWITLNDVIFAFIQRKGEEISFNISTTSVKGSFRLLNDSTKEVYEHEWKIN